MNETSGFPVDGGCSCRALRYRLLTSPLFVHCCHCTWCQRETGSAFAVNAMIESDRVAVTQGGVEVIDTPTLSGKGQKISRCRVCRVALWSNYAGAGEAVRFVRVGTVDPPHSLAPDIHIYTDSKRPWVIIPEGVPAMPEYYSRRTFWPPESLTRLEALKGSRAVRPASAP